MPEQQTTQPVDLKALITSSDTFVTTLITLLADRYGTEFLQWEPETIVMEVEDDFHVDLPQQALDKIMTGVAIMTTDDFFNSLPDFVQHCNVLSGDLYNPELWDPADSSEVAWGITEAMLLWPPDGDTDSPFSEEIVAYIGKVLDDEGIMTPPDVLQIAIRDTDFASMVQNEFSDDPDMFGMIHQFESDKTKQIDGYVRSNLKELSAQMRALPLKSGNAEEAVLNMLRALTSKAESDQGIL